MMTPERIAELRRELGPDILHSASPEIRPRICRLQGHLSECLDELKRLQQHSREVVRAFDRWVDCAEGDDPARESLAYESLDAAVEELRRIVR